MKISSFMLAVLFILPFLWVPLTHPWILHATDVGQIGFVQIAKNEKKIPQGDPGAKTDQIIEAYEKEKLAKFKRHIGRRYLVVRTVRPVEFHHSPEDPQRTFTISKEKEGFLITEVIQNHSEKRYFYRVVFDSGQSGYLMADGNYLELKTLEGSIVPLGRKASAKGKSADSPKGSALRAVELVKNHLIWINPMTGQRMTVESRMAEARAKVFPQLKWRYEAIEIGNNRCRVIQYAEGEENVPLLRTWIVDLLILTVHPENKTAQGLYR